MARQEISLEQAEKLRAGGDLGGAEQVCRAVMEGNPDDPRAYLMLFQVLSQARRRGDAIHVLEAAVEKWPQQAGFYANLGALLAEEGRFDEAIAAQREAIRLAPSHPALHYNLGNSLKTRGHFGDAAASFFTAIRLAPDFAQAHINLGNVLLAVGQTARAIEAYRAGLAITPGDAVGHNNLGNALKVNGEMDAAETSYREALRLTSEIFAEAWDNLGAVCLLTGRLEEASEYIDKARRLAPGNASIHGHYVMMLHYQPWITVPRMKQAVDEWRVKFADPEREKIKPFTNDRSPDRPLRIGYVSPDLRDHPVGRNLVPLFKEHDRAGFEIFCYSEAASADYLAQFFRQGSKQFRMTQGISDDEMAAIIRHDQIDILVDLALHSQGNRLPVFAQKPAPVQATFAGYPGSTGLQTIDYRLTDRHLDPLGGDESGYSEKSICMESFWCFDPVDAPLPVNDLPAANGMEFTFGCLNNFCKVNESTLLLWAKVVRAIPNSRLMLLSPEGVHRGKVRNILLLQGISPGQIYFVPVQNRAAYLQTYQQIDLSLDTLPYNGHTTSLESLFMGVPVVTLAGEMVTGRAGVSQLTNLGMPELIARTPEEFVKIATELAGDLPRLKEMRRTLRERMMASPLMDAKRFAREIENAYRTIWRQWCKS